MDGQDCKRWVDSCSVDLFSSVERVDRNGPINWDVPHQVSFSLILTESLEMAIGCTTQAREQRHLVGGLAAVEEYVGGGLLG